MPLNKVGDEVVLRLVLACLEFTVMQNSPVEQKFSGKVNSSFIPHLLKLLFICRTFQ